MCKEGVVKMGVEGVIQYPCFSRAGQCTAWGLRQKMKERSAKTKMATNSEKERSRAGWQPRSVVPRAAAPLESMESECGVLMRYSGAWSLVRRAPTKLMIQVTLYKKRLRDNQTQHKFKFFKQECKVTCKDQ